MGLSKNGACQYDLGELLKRVDVIGVRAFYQVHEAALYIGTMQIALYCLTLGCCNSFISHHGMNCLYSYHCVKTRVYIDKELG